MQSLCYSPAITPSHPLMRGCYARWKILPWYKSGPRWIDLSTFRNHATLTAAPPWDDSHGRPGSFGALNLNGSSQYADAGNPSWLSYTAGPITVAAWCRPASGNRGDVLTYWGAGGSRKFDLLKGVTSGKFQFFINDSGDNVANSGTSTTTITANVWYFVVGTYDGTSGASAIKLYVNGLLESSGGGAASGGLSSNTSAIQLGADATESVFFDGLIDDLSIFLRELSASEVRQLFDATSRRDDPTLNWIEEEDLFAPTAAAAGYVPYDIPHSPQHQAIMAM